MTINAMGCQHEIASQIVSQEGEYVLGLKGNQGNLSEAIEDFFTTARSHQFAQVMHDYFEEIDKGHCRREIRRYWVSDELSTLPDHTDWGVESVPQAHRLVA